MPPFKMGEILMDGEGLRSEFLAYLHSDDSLQQLIAFENLGPFSYAKFSYFLTRCLRR